MTMTKLERTFIHILKSYLKKENDSLMGINKECFGLDYRLAREFTTNPIKALAQNFYWILTASFSSSHYTKRQKDAIKCIKCFNLHSNITNSSIFTRTRIDYFTKRQMWNTIKKLQQKGFIKIKLAELSEKEKEFIAFKEKLKAFRENGWIKICRDTPDKEGHLKDVIATKKLVEFDICKDCKHKLKCIISTIKTSI